jgi:hypothetical protein
MAARDRKIVAESRLHAQCTVPSGSPRSLHLQLTQYENLPWTAPTIALAPIAVGIIFVFESCYSFASDCYSENSLSAIAGQGFMRNTVGGVARFLRRNFFHDVGSQYAGLILALAASGLAKIPFGFFNEGRK